MLGGIYHNADLIGRRRAGATSPGLSLKSGRDRIHGRVSSMRTRRSSQHSFPSLNADKGQLLVPVYNLQAVDVNLYMIISFAGAGAGAGFKS